MRLSVQPPVYPATMPMTVPIATVMRVALVAMTREIRRPKSSWAPISRPVPHSTPRGWAQLMPPIAPSGLPPRSLISSEWSEYGLMPKMPATIGPKMAVR